MGEPSIMQSVLARLVVGQDLDGRAMEDAVGTIVDGRATAAQIGAFLTALSAKGETAGELVAAVRALRARAVRVPVGGPLLDTCGTGGDGLGTFNVSTATAFVAAAAGLRVAKHGNRAASGSVGAADVLEAAGARIELPPDAAARAIDTIGIAFLFAPAYHPAVRHVAGPRRELGFRTLFNLTGPLCNPANVTHQLVGLYAHEWLEPVARALGELGAVRALVVHGSDGSDEISIAAPTHVVELADGRIRSYDLSPQSLGVRMGAMAEVRGGTAADNARMLRDVLGGKDDGPRTEIVVANAAAALYVAGHAATLADGVTSARRLLAAGSPLAKLDAYVAFSRENGR